MKNKIMFLFLGLFLISFGSAWSEDEFNNSLATENLTFIGDENFTRWLEVPENSFLTSAILNLSGWETSLWNVSSAIYLQDFYVGGEETYPSGMFFKSDGTKMYITGSDTDTIYEYNLGTAWNVSSAIYLRNIKITTEYTLRNMFFKSDGTKMYITGSGVDKVSEYNLGTAWNVSSAIYLRNFKGEETYPHDVFFKSDGTKMYIMGYNNDKVNEYNLGTAWNVSSAIYLQDFYVGGEETYPSGMFFKSDGTKMYITGYGNDKVNEYNLNVAWNVSSAIYLRNFYVGGNPHGVFFKSDGTKMYAIKPDDDKVYEYNLSTKFPTNPYIQINNTKVWNHTGEFNTTAQTSNFAQTINDYIETATAVAGYYLIPNIFHSDTAGILEYLELVFNNEGFTENSQTYSSETAEGNIETFNINFSYDSNEYSTVEAKLIYNNTEYTGTKTSGTGNTVVYSADAIVPQISTDENKTFYWNILVGTTYQNSTSNNQTVYELSIDDCSAHSVLILNMSLKDEELATLVNGSNGANVEIDLILTVPGNPDATQYYYKKWTDENNPQVCITTDKLNYTIDYTIGFDSTDRVWEFLYLDGGILDSTKIFDDYTNYNINLMDLKTTDSTSFLFNYFDVDGLAVDGSMIHVFRKYIGDGTFREVERSKADQNGDTVVHLVEEDVIYYFVITNNGETLYTTSTNTILCQEVPCAIVIEASGVSAEFDTDWDLIDGGAFSISSNANTREVTLIYSKDVSAVWDIDLYKYESDSSFTLLNSSTATGTSGTTSLTVPLSAGNVSFFVAVSVDDVYIKSEWVDFEDNTNDVFGTTLSLFLAGLIILSLGLMAISEGAGVLIWVMLGIFLSGALGLLTTSLSTGISVLTYLIVAGALLVWKIAGGRR